MKKLIALFLVAIMFFSIVSCAKNETDKVTDDDEKETVTKEETEEPNPLAKVIRISLDRYNGKGEFSIYWSDRNGTHLMGVTRVLYRTQKAKVYSEISISSIGSADAIGTSFGEDDELMHLIVVFKKDYKLTDNDKSVIKELGLGYMFEK